MTRAKFLSLVRTELRALKNNATKKELKKLKIDKIIVDEWKSCIYGQMTGDCDSNRAKELTEKAYEGLHDWKRIAIDDEEAYCEFTPLEVWLYEFQDSDYKNVKPKNLINVIKYLKGEISQIKSLNHNGNTC